MNNCWSQILSNRKTIVLVAVRLKSTRLRQKALADLAGAPLIQRLVERLSQATVPEGLVLCTSDNPQDDPLQQISEQLGVECFRGHELDVMSRFIQVARDKAAGTLVRVTGDNPLTDPQVMDAMLDEHHGANAEYTYTEDLPRGTRSEIIDTDALIRCHGLLQDPNASEYMTLMLRRPDNFRVHQYHVTYQALKRPELRLTVDTEEDYNVLASIYRHFNGSPPALQKIIAWLDSRPDILSINSHIQPREIDDTINVRLTTD
jgi:spore coat polysaccharide biosynthesis protein SpsF (cytidylyltransferase family)